MVTQCQQRKCYKCKEIKPLTQEFFCRESSKSDTLRFLCKQCISDAIVLRQKSSKLKWIKYKGGQCEICGYNRTPRSLHFHHRNPNEKDFTIGKYRNRAWETTKAELDKCALLCANCHGEVHDGITKLNLNEIPSR